MSTKKNYRLLVTAIVSALDRSNPTPRHAVWCPTEVMDIQEAQALNRVGIAEVTDAKPTHQTIAEREAGIKADPPLSGVVDAVRQDDGTYRNKAGVRVNEDGSEYTALDDDDLLAILDGSVEDVEVALLDLDVDQLTRLGELEKAGKDRKGVSEAIGDAIADGQADDEE